MRLAPRKPSVSTSSSRASSSSTEPNFWMSAWAVLSPIPFTPGMLSIESPLRPMTSTTFSGGTPNRASTSARPTRRGSSVPPRPPLGM